MMYRGIRKQKRQGDDLLLGTVFIKKKSFLDGDQAGGAASREEWEERQVSSVEGVLLFSLV